MARSCSDASSHAARASSIRCLAACQFQSDWIKSRSMRNTIIAISRPNPSAAAIEDTLPPTSGKATSIATDEIRKTKLNAATKEIPKCWIKIWSARGHCARICASAPAIHHKIGSRAVVLTLHSIPPSKPRLHNKFVLPRKVLRPFPTCRGTAVSNCQRCQCLTMDTGKKLTGFVHSGEAVGLSPTAPVIAALDGRWSVSPLKLSPKHHRVAPSKQYEGGPNEWVGHSIRAFGTLRGAFPSARYRGYPTADL